MGGSRPGITAIVAGPPFSHGTNPVQAAGEGNGTLHRVVLGNEDNVRHSHLNWQFSFSFHIGEQACQFRHSRVWQVSQKIIGDPVRAGSFVG